MKILISAGESSGELIAEYFERVVEKTCPSTVCVRLGTTGKIGPVLGFWEGLRSAVRFRCWLKMANVEVSELKPDLVVLIGFPEFHLVIGRLCRRRDLPVFVIGSPQVWAWGGFRLTQLRKAADKVICLFRFEEQLLKRAGIDAQYLGYPIYDHVVAQRSRDETLKLLGFNKDDRYIVFMPGSRPVEIEFHEPLFVRLFERLRVRRQGLKGVLVRAPGTFLPLGMTWNVNQRYDVIRHAECAVVVSGTATAECALLGTPEVVCYHLSQPTRILARLFVRTPFFAIPNLLAGRRVVSEFLEPTVESLEQEVERLLDDRSYHQQVVSELAIVRRLLGPSGAMERIVQLALNQTDRR
ncbi:MAG: hypothetical protein ABIK44_07750 [candidate division WOR-3 bacterium]